MAKELPKRSEVRMEDTWDLTAMYPSVEAWEEDLEAIQKKAEQAAAYQGRLSENADVFYEAMALFDDTERSSQRHTTMLPALQM